MAFKPSPLLPNEKNRLLAVEKSGVLDVINEEVYNIYCHLSRKITDCPESWANVIDENRQYNFVMDGEDFSEDQKNNSREFPRAGTFCQYAINSPNPLIVSDLRKSTIFRDHPSVLATDGPRFYAAFPLVNSEGYILGSLCVRDYRVRKISKNIIELMKSLASKLSHQLDIQTQQRHTSIEKVLRTVEILDSEFETLTLKESASILKCFSNNLLSKEEKEQLKQLGIFDSQFKLTDKSKKMVHELKLDAAILKRVKIPTMHTNEIDNLFKDLE